MFHQTWTGHEPGDDFIDQSTDDQAAKERFHSVQSEIATAGESGQLITTCRAVPGGYHRSFHLEWWNTERLQPRFDLCQVDPAEPYSTENTGDNFHWIYVERQTLSDFVALCRFIYDDSPFESGFQAERTISNPIAKTTLSYSTKEEIQVLYRARIKSFEGKKPPTRNEDEAYFRETFGISRLRAREIRSELAPHHWKTAGAPSRRSSK